MKKYLSSLNAFFKGISDWRLVKGPLRYSQDGLYTQHNADFMNDPLFSKSYLAGKNTGSWGNVNVHWRAYIACWIAKQVIQLPGDFVECGVNRGGLSRTVMEYIDFQNSNKMFWLLDTYNGLVEKYLSHEERESGKTSGGYEECYIQVCDTFKSFTNVQIIRGAVPETLNKVNASQVCYLSIDMNCALPEIQALEYFWPLMPKGSIVLLDDYGWRGHEKQKEVFDHFATNQNTSVLSLPTGQGLILHP